MIKFMVLGLPRSGTTWAANWLTDNRTICLHDPLMAHRPEQLDSIPSPDRRMVGVACTGLPRLIEWVNRHPAKKIVLHRDLAEINVSLDRLGLNRMTHIEQELLHEIHAVHVPWTDLFDPGHAGHIYEHLTGLPFDRERHRLLTQMHIQPEYAKLPVDRQVVKELVERLGGG